MRLAILALLIPGLHAASEIPQGSHLLLRLVNSVSTRTAREGDYVYMKTCNLTSARSIRKARNRKSKPGKTRWSKAAPRAWMPDASLLSPVMARPLGGIADRGWKGAGIGAGAGGAVGLATVLLTRGREVDLRQGSTLDVVFERAVPVR
ncbi:MAG TPA: hypothetical protein VGH38_33715 [Bryobacteraceae bacterium]|jgi:hypothetical protein